MRLEIANDGGREADIAKYSQVLGIQKDLGAAQQSLDGPLTDHNKILATVNRLVQAMGIKGVEELVMQPDPPGQPAQPQQPAPNPAVMKAQADAQLQAQKIQSDAQQKQAELAQKAKRASGRHGVQGRSVAVE